MGEITFLPLDGAYWPLSSATQLHFSCYSSRPLGEGHWALGTGPRIVSPRSCEPDPGSCIRFLAVHRAGTGNTSLQFAVCPPRLPYSVDLVTATSDTVSRVFFPEEYVFKYSIAAFSTFLV